MLTDPVSRYVCSMCSLSKCLLNYFSLASFINVSETFNVLNFEIKYIASLVTKGKRIE